jgi:hypothetical protein
MNHKPNLQGVSPFHAYVIVDDGGYAQRNFVLERLIHPTKFI